MTDPTTDALRELAEAMREHAAATREHTAELRRQREKRVATKRQKALRNASSAATVEVSETAALRARRALGKVGP